MWWGNFINGTIIEEEWRENFRMSKMSLVKLAEELRLYIEGKASRILPYLSTQDFQLMLLAICFVLYSFVTISSCSTSSVHLYVSAYFFMTFSVDLDIFASDKLQALTVYTSQ